MQRLSAILLLALFSFTLTAPVWSADSEAKLPPCCRRDGQHGCGMKMKTTPLSTGVAWRAIVRCALFGKGGVTPAAAKTIINPPGGFIALALITHPSAIEQIEARYRVWFSRSRQKRGPPTPLS